MFVFNISPDGRNRHQGTLELIGRIGRNTWRFMLNSGSTGNHIFAQVCTAHRVRVEEDLYPDHLTMADGSMTKTQGRVQIRFKYGSTRELLRQKFFLAYNNINLGYPLVEKGKPTH